MAAFFELEQGGQSIPVALAHCHASREPGFQASMESLLQASDFAALAGKTVLVKPNLLKAEALACTDPRLVASLCRCLLDLGCKVTVADSPGFGTLAGVAAKIGLEQALAPLGLRPVPMGSALWKDVEIQGARVKIPISRTAFDCETIVSVPKVKAHSQMRLTLAVKNCYGCVPGLHKAFLHARFGKQRACFAELIAALYQLLPPVVAVVDGIVAMHVTGPGSGQPYPLGLVAACSNAPLLDEELLCLLGCTVEEIPLALALRRAGVYGSGKSCVQASYPLAQPTEWRVEDFQVPEILLTTSFAPHRLLRSLWRRLWAQRPFFCK